MLIPVIVASLALAAVAVWLVLRSRPSPEARERRRRLDVNAKGHMTDAMVVDVLGDELHYTYTVRGVEYLAAQDVSALAGCLTAGEGRLIGPAIVKYIPRNPANSIVVCEGWSGLRGGERQ
jgi:hypothetical protein